MHLALIFPHPVTCCLCICIAALAGNRVGAVAARHNSRQAHRNSVVHARIQSRTCKWRKSGIAHVSFSLCLNLMGNLCQTEYLCCCCAREEGEARLCSMCVGVGVCGPSLCTINKYNWHTMQPGHVWFVPAQPRAMISHAETDSAHSLPLGRVIVCVPRIGIRFYFLRGGRNIRGVLHPTTADKEAAYVVINGPWTEALFYAKVANCVASDWRLRCITGLDLGSLTRLPW